MRAVAAVPASGLIAGAALGLLFPETPVSVSTALLASSGALAASAWRAGRARLLAACICLAFGAGGVLLSGHAWHEAMRPSLRAAFDELAADERATADTAGRTHPEELTATATIVNRTRPSGSQTGFR